jgi:hypothetical protein
MAGLIPHAAPAVTIGGVKPGHGGRDSR